jgi:Asp-tRNA(Asn)/Glu-tRNA(Gln) amidotransferase A subunit family amidase
MALMESPIAGLRRAYREQQASPVGVLESALARANSNAGRNVYLAQDAGWSRAEASRLDVGKREAQADSVTAAQPLWGVPISLKDCFDLAGFRTSCGSTFYAERNGVAAEDSEVARRLRAAGAVITGKTHLHMLAYGITGENRDYGDCLQPRDAGLLTGGSSSGAAASVQEGSALAAIGTDTGGSVRAPAALCGIAGYRSSVSLSLELWRGGAHLAESFDSVGWLYGDLRDGPVLGDALFGYGVASAPKLSGLRIGVPGAEFLRDTEPEILTLLEAWCGVLADAGATVTRFDASGWENVLEFFAPLQAYEAAGYQRGLFEHFEPAIAERLAWGASFSAEDAVALRKEHAGFRESMRALMERFDFLLLPASPVAALRVGEDHAGARAKILRYTIPMSAAGTPAVTMPGRVGGVQLAGRVGGDAELLALTAVLREIAPE